MSCRVLIVEDDDAFVEILEVLLDGEQFEIVGRGRNGTEAIELARELAPDVVTMDLDMPGIDGVDATREILDSDGEQRVVVVSGSDADDRVDASRAAGAAAFVAKARAADELPDVLLAVCRGVELLGRR